MADGTLKVGTITNSAGSGNITIGSGVTLLSNVPAFQAHLSSDQSITDNTFTKVEFDTEELDTDNAYNTSTGEFTVPSGKGGKYMVGASYRTNASGAATRLASFITVGGTIIRQTNFNQNSDGESSSMVHAVLNLSAGDVVAFKCFQTSGSSVNLEADGKTYFYGYRIGA